MGLKNLVKKAVNKLTTHNMRKYVWYDYSIVEKAKIRILKNTKGTQIGRKPEVDDFEFLAELPVQINPYSIPYEHRMGTSDIFNGITSNVGKEGNAQHFFSGHESSSFDPELVFDIYDEYNARTANGAIPTDFSLMNDKVTSLPKLIYYARLDGVYAGFTWGDIKKFGLLTGISGSYSAFSQWGQPLKATATIHIVEQSVVGGAEKLLEDSFGGFTSVKTAVKRIATLKQNIFR